jgi:hypothetical protein
VTRAGQKKNLAASVRDRLSKVARARKEDPNFVFNRYAMERFLYRLSRSVHEPKFVLKGALLFTVWSGHPHRATKDIDLLGTGAPDLARLAQIFRDVCCVSVEDDGLAFDPATVTTMRIKEDANYEGVRVQFRGTLGTAVLNLQVDIGFGDAVTPAPTTVDFPVLLEFPPARIRIYPRETVVAEKLEAMVYLGLANSRMKDFFDLAFLARTFEFDGDLLTKAIANTFANRETPVPMEPPVAFTTAFAEDPQKKAQWTGFLKRSGVMETNLALSSVVGEIRTFVNPPLEALRGGVRFTQAWSRGAWHG